MPRPPGCIGRPPKQDSNQTGTCRHMWTNDCRSEAWHLHTRGALHLVFVALVPLSRLITARVTCRASFCWLVYHCRFKMAAPSAGPSHDADSPPHVGPSNAPVDTAHLDKLVEKALTALKSGRCTLAAAFYRHTADEALRLHGDTFVCTNLTLRRASLLVNQSQLEDVLLQKRGRLSAPKLG